MSFRPNRPSGRPFLPEGFERIAAALGVSEVWAWGSRVRGDYEDDSDWDVLVTSSPGRDQIWRRREAARVSGELGITVDLVLVADPLLFPGSQLVTIGEGAP